MKNNIFSKQINDYLTLMENVDDTPIIKRNYKFIQHPIRWFKDIKRLKISNSINRKFWNDNKSLLEKAIIDILIDGKATINEKDFKL